MPKAKLAWSENDYTPYMKNLYGRHTEAEVRAEYTRIRDIMHKRMMRMKAQNPDAPFVRNFDELFPRLRDLDKKMQDKTSRWQFAESKEQALAVLITEAGGALNAQGTSLREQKIKDKEEAGHFRESGYSFVTSSNIGSLRDFFQSVYEKYERTQVDSEAVIDVWHWANSRKLDPMEVLDAYDSYQGKQEEFFRSFRVKGGYKRASSEDIQNQFRSYADRLKSRGV